MANDWLTGKFYSPYKVKFINEIPLCPECNSEMTNIVEWEASETCPAMGMAYCETCKANFKILLEEKKQHEDPDQLKMFEEE